MTVEKKLAGIILMQKFNHAGYIKPKTIKLFDFERT